MKLQLKDVLVSFSMTLMLFFLIVLGRNTSFVSAPWRLLGCYWCLLESCWRRRL